MQQKPSDLFVALVRLLNEDDAKPTLALRELSKTARLLHPEDGSYMLARISGQLDTLRALVNEWIDSGIKADGCEEPRSRHLIDGTFIEYMDEAGQVVAVARPKSLIRRLVYAYQQKHPPTIHLKRNGGILFSFAGEGGAENDGPPEQEAVRLFVQLYSTRWAFRLMRCHSCKVYELVPTPRRLTYAHGWHCGRCCNPASAVRAVNNRRKKEKEKKLEVSAKAWRESGSKRGNNLAWVVEKANDNLPLSFRRNSVRITRNYITRNLAEIQRLAKESLLP